MYLSELTAISFMTENKKTFGTVSIKLPPLKLKSLNPLHSNPLSPKIKPSKPFEQDLNMTNPEQSPGCSFCKKASNALQHQDPANATDPQHMVTFVSSPTNSKKYEIDASDLRDLPEPVLQGINTFITQERQLSLYRAEKQALQSDRDKLQCQLDSNTNAFINLQFINQGLSETVTSVKAERDSLIYATDQYKQRQSDLEAELKRCQTNYQKAVKAEENCRRQNLEAQAKLRKLQTTHDQLQQKHNKLEINAANQTKSFDALKKGCAEMEKHVVNLQQTCDKTQAEKQNLKTALTAAQEDLRRHQQESTNLRESHQLTRTLIQQFQRTRNTQLDEIETLHQTMRTAGDDQLTHILQSLQPQENPSNSHYQQPDSPTTPPPLTAILCRSPIHIENEETEDPDSTIVVRNDHLPLETPGPASTHLQAPLTPASTPPTTHVRSDTGSPLKRQRMSQTNNNVDGDDDEGPIAPSAKRRCRVSDTDRGVVRRD